jgi:hypothetical protein
MTDNGSYETVYRVYRIPLPGWDDEPSSMKVPENEVWVFLGKEIRLDPPALYFWVQVTRKVG